MNKPKPKKYSSVPGELMLIEYNTRQLILKLESVMKSLNRQADELTELRQKFLE